MNNLSKKVHLTYTVSFLLILATAIFSLNALSGVMRKRVTFSDHANQALKTDDFKALAIGSSRFYSSFRPDIIDGILTTALPMADGKYLNRLVKKRWENIKKAKVIYLEVSPEILLTDSLSVYPSILPALRSYELAPPRERGNRYIYENILSHRFRPVDIYDKFKMSRIKKAEEFYKKMERRGYKAQGGSKATHFIKDEAKTYQNRIGKYASRAVFKANEKAYMEILEMFEKEGIKVHLLKMPTHPLYRQRMPQIWTRSFERFINRNNLQERIIEYSAYGPHFHDAVHLNRLGGVRFCTWLINNGYATKNPKSRLKLK